MTDDECVFVSLRTRCTLNITLAQRKKDFASTGQNVATQLAWAVWKEVKWSESVV